MEWKNQLGKYSFFPRFIVFDKSIDRIYKWKEYSPANAGESANKEKNLQKLSLENSGIKAFGGSKIH
jgi:hypothetical protein